MNKQMFLKLILITTSKYILSRLLRVIDGKLFYQDADRTNEVLYSCSVCNYFTTKSLIHISNKCPCCSHKKLDVFASEDISTKNTTTISKRLDNIYKEAF